MLDDHSSVPTAAQIHAWAVAVLVRRRADLAGCDAGQRLTSVGA
ncbi:hypothetical protein [Kibdelosporangium philippinense]